MQADGQEAANEADGDKEEDDEQQERMGRGGWLVNLVDYLQPQPSTATADDEA